MVSPGDTLDQLILDKSVPALFQSEPVLPLAADLFTYQVAAWAETAHMNQTVTNRMRARTVFGKPLAGATDLLGKTSRAQPATKSGDLTGSEWDNGVKADLISPRVLIPAR